MTDIQAPPAIVVDGVSKQFRIPHERINTLKERALHPFRRTDFRQLTALDDVSFMVGAGEFFGIVGRNGSGKSTLLKCMAGIYGVDAGEIYIDGRLSTFIELGVGFNADLAARDNVTLNAIMLGLSQSEARARYDRVIEFAELEDFVDLKLKNYSSGMTVRLAFSVMIQVDADVLLIDEVLAVGDAAFQQKCYDEFNRLRDQGRTLLLVTHDMNAVNRFCHRAMLLEQGKIVTIDESHAVSNAYLELNFKQKSAAEVLGAAADERTSALITDAWFEDESGVRVDMLSQGRRCTFKVVVDFTGDVDNPSVSFALEDDLHKVLFAASTAWKEEETGHFSAGDRLTVGFEFENPFASGRYYATPTVARRGAGKDVIHRRARVTSVVISGGLNSGGQVDLPHDMTLERSRTRRGAEVSS